MRVSDIQQLQNLMVLHLTKPLFVVHSTNVYKGARFIDLSQLAGLKQPQWETRLNRQVWPVKFGQRAVGLSLQLSAAVEKETKDQANQEIKVKNFSSK